MSGYLGRPQATSATIDDEGWLHTGDLVRIDDDGNLFIVDHALMAWVAARVAPHKRVRRVEFIDAIPKSPSGKILRRVLVERESRRGS
jgi:acyl-CoA synthetase (AMP-forming)/AMP-acid ligase II